MNNDRHVVERDVSWMRDSLDRGRSNCGGRIVGRHRPRPMVWWVGLALAAGLAGCEVSSSATRPPEASTVSQPSASPLSSLASRVTASPSAAVVVPAGRLVFDRFSGGPEGPWLGTFVAGSDGANPVEIKLPTAADGGLAAVWSPDGKRLLVTIWAPPSGPARAGIINADGTGLNILEPKGLDGDDLGCSAWAPDGKTILCTRGSADAKREGIYRMRTDGTGLTRLTASPFHHVVGTTGECGGGDSRAIFSPDGRQFGFIRQRCGTEANPSSGETGAILVGNIDGTGRLREVVAQGGVRTHPGSQLSWSPDGGAIAFGTQDFRLRTVHPDGSGVADINIAFGTTGVTGVFGPVWSPDGTRIVFSTFSGGNPTDLYIVAPDGTQLVKVLGTRGGSFVDWGKSANP